MRAELAEKNKYAERKEKERERGKKRKRKRESEKRRTKLKKQMIEETMTVEEGGEKRRE